MDLTSNKYLEPPTLFPSQVDAALESNTIGMCNRSMKNPFLDSFSDPFCKLNLKETSDFVNSFPGPNHGRGISAIPAQNGATKRNVEAPLTPGRPIFSFSSSNYSRKCFPSKWDDAEKWVVSGSSCNDSPGNNNHGMALVKTLESSKMYSRQCSGYKPQMGEIFAEKSRITEEKVSKVVSTAFQAEPLGAVNGVALSASTDVLPKDKFANEFDSSGHSGPMQEKFLFGNPARKPTSEHRDVGTEMTPLASSTTSRSPTPFESTSPARPNTPADRSGPLGLLGPADHSRPSLAQLQDRHLAKLHCGAQFDSNWSSREEEEDDVSKSLRHFEVTSGEGRKSVSDSRNFMWEEEKNKTCLRYQREEAKIQAWVNLQSAKAEAESRKLEVKIQKMRANLEEKLMKRMAEVSRKAEEWRADARFQHSEQIRKACQQAINKRNNNNNSSNINLHLSGRKYCGCFPCNK